MSSGFNPLSMFKPTGNPVVQKLLQNRQSSINDLLDQQSFLTQFRKENHELLEKFMTYKKYQKLVEYITQLGSQQDKVRGYKYPYIAAQILSIDNSHTYKYFVSKKPIVEQQIIIEQTQIEKQIDSDKSFMSSRSEGSIISNESQTQKQSENNQVEDIQQLQEIKVEKTPSEIDEDDFPFLQDVKKTKLVKQKRQIIVMHQYQPLIKKLYAYFQKPLNHTLTGYVCKVINALLSKNSSIYAELLQKVQGQLFIEHIQSRSIEQLLIRLMTFQSSDQNDLKLQYNLILLCLHKINDENRVVVIQNLSFLVSQILSKISNDQNTSSHLRSLAKQILQLSFFAKISEYFKQIIKQREEINHEKKQSKFELCETKIKQFSKIFSSFLDFYLKVKNKEEYKSICTGIEIEYEDHINQFVESAYKKLELQALDNDKKVLSQRFGMTKILLINIIFTILKEKLGFCQSILAEKECFFEILLQLVENSPLNSILHNAVFSIFEFFVSNLEKTDEKSNSAIIDSLSRLVFDTNSEKSFLLFSHSNLEQNQQLLPCQKKGYIGHLMKICIKISNLKDIQHLELLQEFKNHKLWKQINQRYIDPYLQRTKVSLGNFEKKRNMTAAIEFDRSKILQNHRQFLKGTKFSTLDQFSNFELEQNDSEDIERRPSISTEASKQMEQMEIEQFYLNSGLQPDKNRLQ